MVTFGSAFSDEVVADRHRRSRSKEESPWWAGSGRALIFATILVIGFFVLIWRLFDLTVINGRAYRRLSDSNRTYSLTRHAPRGILLDRTGKPLVKNIAIERNVKDGFTEVDYMRQYVLGSSTAHLLGYVGELGEEELSSDYYKSRNYTIGDRVGRMGAEEVYNERLRGRDGREYVEVDANGSILRSLGREEALPGEDITLSLDVGLSKVAADAFPKDEKGAIVVTKPTTGEILALYSSPGFSPDAFSRGMTQGEFYTLMNNPDLPLFNRAIGGVYPPGSTFKIVTSIAGLEEKALTKDTIVEDNGVITIGPFTFPNWYFLQYGKTEGNVDLVKALKRSNDIFFYKAGEWIGITKLAGWARKVGIGTPLGIELSGEVGGLMPDPAWKKARFDTEADRTARNDEWYVGDTYHVSIGQGYLLTTPLAVNTWTNVIANGGNKCRPTIEKVSSVKYQVSKSCEDLKLKKDTIDLIMEGMREACAPGGTGWPLFNFSVKKSTDSAAIAVPIACKTGTAEFGDPKDRTHAWFTAFGPVPDQFIPEDMKKGESYVSGVPEISITVLVEGAGEGSNVAAPIAKKIFEEWFGR